MILTALLLLQAAPAPAADTADLSRRVADTSTLAELLPMIAMKEAGDLIKDHPELSAEEQAALRTTATEVMTAARTRLIAALAPTYAGALSPDQMRAIVAFEEGDAAKARRAADLPALMGAAKVLEGYDFKKEVLTSFCAKTGKACPAK